MAEPNTPLPPEPWWTRLIPDVRGLVTAGYFGLALRLLYMIEGNADLLKDSAFMTLATLIMGSGGLGIIITFLFGGTKTGADVMTSQNASVVRAASGTGNGGAQAGGQGDPTHVVVDQPAGKPVPVTEAPKGPSGPAADFMEKPL